MQFSNERYAKLVEDTIVKMKQLIELKGGEYAAGEDRLINFRRNAEQSDCTMEQVWRIYAGKHWDAITQYIKDVAAGVERPRAESIKGRADDMIVYLTLFKAMVEEKEQQKNRYGTTGQQKILGAVAGGFVYPYSPAADRKRKNGPWDEYETPEQTS